VTDFAILPIVEKFHVPMVEGNGAARELFSKGYRYIFAVLSTSDQYLTGVIDLAAENASGVLGAELQQQRECCVPVGVRRQQAPKLVGV
jgi:hypothetical protein